jgi:hypothetical protein
VHPGKFDPAAPGGTAGKRKQQHRCAFAGPTHSAAHATNPGPHKARSSCRLKAQVSRCAPRSFRLRVLIGPNPPMCIIFSFHEIAASTKQDGSPEPRRLTMARTDGRVQKTGSSPNQQHLTFNPRHSAFSDSTASGWHTHAFLAPLPNHCSSPLNRQFSSPHTLEACINQKLQTPSHYPPAS